MVTQVHTMPVAWEDVSLRLDLYLRIACELPVLLMRAGYSECSGYELSERVQ